MQPPSPQSEDPHREGPLGKEGLERLLAAGALTPEQVARAQQKLEERRAAGHATTLQEVLFGSDLIGPAQLRGAPVAATPKPQAGLEPGSQPGLEPSLPSEAPAAGRGATTLPGAPSPGADLPEAGERFGRFELLEVLGEGGMGRVYLARDPRLGREVALKLIRARQHLDRFPREARAMARVSHPHVVTVYEFEEAEGFHYLVMEAVQGVDLTTYRRSQGVPAFLRALEQVARAVAQAHAQGVVHRDLKPDNVLVDAAGHARVTDFGIAQVLDASGPALTQTGAAIGTPLYMAPEQCVGDKERMGPPGDVWSLGVLLYEGLCDRLPFRGASFLELVAEIASQEPPPISSLCDLPRVAELEAICARALAKRPEQRYADAGGFAADLARYLAGTQPSRGPWLGALVLVALGVGLGLALRPGPAPAAPSVSPSRTPAQAPAAGLEPSAAWRARSANLLSNPGFELGEAGCEGWELEGASGTRKAPYSEFSSVEVSAGGGSLRQVVALGERAWRRVRLSGMFQAEASGQAELALEWSGPSPGRAAVQGALEPGRWSLVAGEVSLPAGIDSATFVAQAAGAKVDELALEGLDEGRLAEGTLLPTAQPVVHAFRGLDGGQGDLGAYRGFHLHTEYALDHARRLRRAFPARPVLKQQAFGAITLRGAQAKVYPGHWLYARGLPLASPLPARRRFELELEAPGGLRPFTRGGQERFPEAALVRRRGGALDLSRALHVRIIGLRGEQVLCEALHHYPPGEPPLTFAAGEGVLLPHLPWRGSDSWLLNLDPAGPAGPGGEQAADVYVAHLAERAAGASGVSLDLPYWIQDRLPGYPLDLDLDGVPDGGFREGLNVYGLGQGRLLRRLRQALGPRALIVADGEPDKARAWSADLDGFQVERFLFREGAQDRARLARFGFQFDHLRNVVGRLDSPRRASYALCVVDSARYRQPEGELGLEEARPEADDPLVRIGFVSNLLLDLPHAYVERDRSWRRPRATLSDPFWPVPWGFYRAEDPGWLGQPLEPLRVASAHLRAQIKIGAWQLELASAPGYAAAHPLSGDDPRRTHRVEVQSVPKGRPETRGVELRSVLPARLRRGESYTLVFEARGQSRYRYAGEDFAGAPRSIQVAGLRAEAGNATRVLVDERWRMYSLVFRAGRQGPSEIRFGLSEQVGWTELRKVRLLRGAAARYTRRYERGLAVLNLSEEPWTQDLPPGEWELVLGPGELDSAHLRVPAGEAVVLRER